MVPKGRDVRNPAILKDYGATHHDRKREVHLDENKEMNSSTSGERLKGQEIEERVRESLETEENQTRQRVKKREKLERGINESLVENRGKRVPYVIIVPFVLLLAWIIMKFLSGSWKLW